MSTVKHWFDSLAIYICLKLKICISNNLQLIILPWRTFVPDFSLFDLKSCNDNLHCFCYYSEWLQNVMLWNIQWSLRLCHTAPVNCLHTDQLIAVCRHCDNLSTQIQCTHFHQISSIFFNHCDLLIPGEGCVSEHLSTSWPTTQSFSTWKNPAEC